MSISGFSQKGRDSKLSLAAYSLTNFY